MFESDEAVRENVRKRAVGLSREEVALQRDNARSRCEGSRVHCAEAAMRREWLEQYAAEWQRVLDELTERVPKPR
ncbi:hypothetical protein ACFWIN_16755 [Streptomyces sp. NPDC127049]|uniref:hypothetical protein n=1 Tax=Streptomyces sp. NPDC127049 TaxID=3347118 RepID=UPI003648BBBF